jgi:hypothetical protein
MPVTSDSKGSSVLSMLTELTHLRDHDHRGHYGEATPVEFQGDGASSKRSGLPSWGCPPSMSAVSLILYVVLAPPIFIPELKV